MRNSEARATSAGFVALISSTTVNSPVGCCTENVLRGPAGSSRHAVCNRARSHRRRWPTVTAPSTPTAAWQSCGMKVRV